MKLLKLNFFVTAIVTLLSVYIVALNFTVSENFRRGEVERDIKVARQDIQEKEEVFISNLNIFYDQYSAAFGKGENLGKKYVQRESNFALSNMSRANLR